MDRAVVVAITEGLHARPAALFAKTAAADCTSHRRIADKAYKCDRLPSNNSG